MRKIKWLQYSVGILGTLGLFLAIPQDIFAHGYINNSRAHLAHLGINQNAGSVQYEPQSVEGIGNFPLAGPVDGQIAGGEKYPELDIQTIDRWEKIPLTTGVNTFTWTLTAPHRTDEWKYYITKEDWNPNSPLTRSDLELLTIIDEDGIIPPSTVTHTINIPTGRTGYHILLGVWEIEDTSNAFYQVMDIELNK